jgi:selenocysteine-specific elongation factor
VSHVIIGTAGHVDHGKTALIKALTGEDTDRLQEEKDRGISIELGFAPFKLPSGRLAGVVDVPGHERFIHNMLAGIGGIDLVLLVVDVTEGVMPQTREHVDIMELLQIKRGIVVLTKADMAEDADWLDLVEEEVRDALAGTFLADAPYHRVSAMTGAGLDELLVCIDRLTGELPARDVAAPLRLPVDRVFSITGFGTIVTGTLLAGSIHSGMNVEVMPLGERVRVRQIQVHGSLAPEAVAGQRAAVNLPGVDKDSLPRGSVLAAPGSLTTTYMMDARLQLLPGAPRAIKNMTRIHIYLSTGRSVGRVFLLDSEELQPGDKALVQFRLEKPLVAQGGDRFIIRSYSPMTTIGGGMVLDASSVKHKRFKKEILERLAELEKGDAAAPLLQRIRRESAVAAGVLEKQSGLAPETLVALLERLVEENKVVKVGNLLVDAFALAQWRSRILETLHDYHAVYPLAVGMSRALLRSALPKDVPQKIYDYLLTTLVEQQEVAERDGLVALKNHHPAPGPEEATQIEKIALLYLEGGFTPPALREVAEKVNISPEQAETLAAYLAWSGILVRLDEQLALHTAHFQRAKQILCDHFQEEKTLTAAVFRDKLGTTRKFVLPLLETFDRLKWTRRLGDERVPWRLDINNCGEVE